MWQECEEARARAMLPGSDGWEQESLDKEELEIFQLKPSFRAEAILVDPDDYNVDPYADTGKMPVCLVCTGLEADLSAPIDFELIAANGGIKYYVGEDGKTREAIRTTLETAFRFLMELDQREAAVFGAQPDPTTLRHGWGKWEEVLANEARRLGWKGDMNLLGPSSAWVETDLFPDWIETRTNRARMFPQDREDNRRRDTLRILS